MMITDFDLKNGSKLVHELAQIAGKMIDLVVILKRGFRNLKL